MSHCKCALLHKVQTGGVEFYNLRCPACADAIVEAKNELVRENQRLLRGDFTEEEFQGLCHGLPEDAPERFARDCVQYNRKLFGARQWLCLLDPVPKTRPVPEIDPDSLG